jgi:carboxylesterase
MNDYSFYWEGSSGKGVLLVHGLTGAPMEMKFIGKQLHKRGYSVYAPTLPGHCQDKRSLLRTKFEDWLSGLRESLHLFRKKVKEVHAAGICVGGALALYLAYSEPTLLETVVIYSATLNYDGWNVPFYYPWARYGIPLLIHLPFVKRLAFSETAPYGIKSERVRKMVMSDGSVIAGALPSFPMGTLYENYRLNKALEKALPLIQTPTLLIHAKEDDVSHPRNADRIQKLHGGRCELVLLDDSYHMLHIDQERHKVADLTIDFFEEKRCVSVAL